MQVCLPLFPSATVCICDTICEFFVHVTQLTQSLKTLAVRTHASGGLRVWSADVRLTFAPTVPQLLCQCWLCEHLVDVKLNNITRQRS
jgi:hypothetical protein